jgi:hypothetical protein
VIRSAVASLALTAAIFVALPASAQTFGTGEQCRPATADVSQLRDCRVHTVAEKQTCRCAVMPGINAAARSTTTASNDALPQNAAIRLP